MKMPPVYVPFGSSEKDELQPDQNEALSRRQAHKGGNKRGNTTSEKTRSVLKVKLPKPRKTGTKNDKTPGRWMLEPAAAKGAGTDSDSVGGDVFSFSQRPTSKEINEKEKAKLAVLRTISKVLKENQIIRQRLTALSQTNLKLC